MRIGVPGQRTYVLYIDPNLSNPMMPAHLKQQISEQIVPTDADAILVTHSHYNLMACALPLALASQRPDCRIACAPEIAQQLRGTALVNESKLLELELGGSVDLGYLRITMVHADHAAPQATVV